MKNYYLAIDIGASSGRHIVGWEEDGKIVTDEVFRFPNGAKNVEGHLEWDIESLFSSVKLGIKRALNKYPEIRSLAIDSWGVDYVIINGGKPFIPCLLYRDSARRRTLTKCTASCRLKRSPNGARRRRREKPPFISISATRTTCSYIWCSSCKASM